MTIVDQKKRTSVHLLIKNIETMKEKNLNVSGTLNTLLDNFVKNNCSTEFFYSNKGNNSNNAIADKRKINFLKKMCRILNEINKDLKNTGFSTDANFKVYLEILTRHGLKQDEYAQMEGMI